MIWVFLFLGVVAVAEAVTAGDAGDDAPGADFVFWGTPYYASDPCVRGNIVQLSMGILHAAAVLDGGDVVCWGGNFFGESNVPSDRSRFRQSRCRRGKATPRRCLRTARCDAGARTSTASAPSRRGWVPPDIPCDRFMPRSTAPPR